LLQLRVWLAPVLGLQSLPMSPSVTYAMTMTASTAADEDPDAEPLPTPLRNNHQWLNAPVKLPENVCVRNTFLNVVDVSPWRASRRDRIIKTCPALTSCLVEECEGSPSSIQESPRSTPGPALPSQLQSLADVFGVGPDTPTSSAMPSRLQSLRDVCGFGSPGSRGRQSPGGLRLVPRTPESGLPSRLQSFADVFDLDGREGRGLGSTCGHDEAPVASQHAGQPAGRAAPSPRGAGHAQPVAACRTGDRGRDPRTTPSAFFPHPASTSMHMVHMGMPGVPSWCPVHALAPVMMQGTQPLAMQHAPTLLSRGTVQEKQAPPETKQAKERTRRRRKTKQEDAQAHRKAKLLAFAGLPDKAHT